MSTWAPCFGVVLFMLCEQPAPPPPPPPVVVCLRTKDWSREYQARLKTSLKDVASDSPIITAMSELISLRDQNKTCKRMKK